MGARRLGRLLALCALAVCALPATADAAMRKATGETSQGRSALVWVRDDNSVALVRVSYVADCRKAGFESRGRMYYRDNQRKPFVRNGANFSDGGKFEQRTRRHRAVFNTAMTGAPSADGGWEGTFRVQLRVYNRRGRLIDFCKTGVLTWKVGPPQGS